MNMGEFSTVGDLRNSIANLPDNLILVVPTSVWPGYTPVVGITHQTYYPQNCCAGSLDPDDNTNDSRYDEAVLALVFTAMI
jgi:hypothetical protein